jgi:hypothetical protein
LFDDFNDHSRLKKILACTFLFFFGAFFILTYLIIQLHTTKWLKNEVRFIYHFYLSDYWKNAVENNENKTSKEMLEELNEFAENHNKQVQRHNRLIQKRYENSSI